MSVVRDQITVWSLSMLLVGLLASCHHDSIPQAVGTGPTPTAPLASPQKHWMQNQRLKAVMDQISKLHTSFPKGLPEDVESSAGPEALLAAANAANAADELARTALRIPAVLEGKSLSEADRRGFIAEAQTLHDQAMLLRDSAQKFQVEEMQQTLDGLTSSCISCHNRFRDLSGELDCRKASLPGDNLDGLSMARGH
jgi:cytochrome c556